MACSTGEACGLTATRSPASRWANHSAVITDTSDALRGLVAADLDPVAGLALAVGRVDDADGEPEHAALDLLEHVEVDLGLGGSAHDGLLGGCGLGRLGWYVVVRARGQRAGAAGPGPGGSAWPSISAVRRSPRPPVTVSTTVKTAAPVSTIVVPDGTSRW